MSPLAQILIAGVGTYLIRISFIGLAGRIGEIPPRVRTMLSMIPPSVLAAITANSLVLDGDSVRGLDEWHIAIVVIGLVSWKTKNVALCLFVGMPTLWALAALA